MHVLSVRDATRRSRRGGTRRTSTLGRVRFVCYVPVLGYVCVRTLRAAATSAQWGARHLLVICEHCPH
jgi:hypothetical protein